MNTQWRGAGGFTLIEVLVALVLLAAAALGAGATVLAANRAGRQSSLMSAAVQLAAKAADSMRANRAVAGGADAANPYLQLDYDALADGAPAAADNDCSGAACDGAALAAADLAGLRRNVFEHYPLGRIKICRDGASWDAAASIMRWDCDGAGGAPVVVKLGWRERTTLGGEGDGAAAGGAAVMVALPLVVAGQVAGAGAP